MRWVLLVIAISACNTKTFESEMQAHKARIQDTLDTLDIALVRTDDQKAADIVDINSVIRGEHVPMLPDELRRTRPMQVLATRSVIDRESAVARCQELLTDLAFKSHAQVMTDELSATLKACEGRYIQVIEGNDDVGHHEYVELDTGIRMGSLSRAGTFEIFDVRDKKRIVSVSFPVSEPPPETMTATERSHLDQARLYRAADQAFGKLLAARR